jgi:hypothetical protein
LLFTIGCAGAPTPEGPIYRLPENRVGIECTQRCSKLKYSCAATCREKYDLCLYDAKPAADKRYMKAKRLYDRARGRYDGALRR